MPDPLHYALALGFCLVVTLPLEALGTGVYRRPRRLLTALVPALVFVVWDVAAAARGHWSFDPTQVLALPRLAGLPVEELLFFLVVPTCTILTLEAVRGLLGRARRDRTGGQGARAAAAGGAARDA
jgi:lycopene cyclase domain-containing protein